MSVWDNTRYNQDGQPVYPGAPRNEPFDLIDGLRNVATLKGVLPFRSVDPRAVDYGQPVSTLVRGTYDGQQVRYRHTAGVAPWWGEWDSSLNGGIGAWAVTSGPPLIAVQSAGASGSSAAIDTWTALPNTPTIAIPVAGIWDITAAGNITNEFSGAKQARVRIWNGTSGSRIIGSLVASGAAQSSSPGGAAVRMALTAGTVSLQMCTDNTTVTFGAAAELWSLFAMPVELRP